LNEERREALRKFGAYAAPALLAMLASVGGLGHRRASLIPSPFAGQPNLKG